MLVTGLDAWDFIGGASFMHIVQPYPYETISSFEFDSRVFSGEIVNPEIGSIVEPQRTVKFFPITNSMHVINKHFSNNVTSVKKSIRALMPSNFITEPHWIVLYATLYFIDSKGVEKFESFFSSTMASSSVDSTYQQLLNLLTAFRSGYGTGEGQITVNELSIVIRREL